MEFDAVWIYVWPGIYFSRLFELVVEEDSDGTVSEEIVSKDDLRWIYIIMTYEIFAVWFNPSD